MGCPTAWIAADDAAAISGGGESSSDEAVDAVKAACGEQGRPFDVVLMDEDFGHDLATHTKLKLGTEVTPEIRAYLATREERRTLIFGATGYESPAHLETALAAGQDGVFGKPYEEGPVQAVLLRWLANRT